jgi:hypothetical protein
MIPRLIHKPKPVSFPTSGRHLFRHAMAERERVADDTTKL